MNYITYDQEIPILVNYLRTMVSPDIVATFISPNANLTYLSKKIRYGYKKHADAIFNELVIFFIEEIKKSTNSNTIYWFQSWQKDKFRYVQDDVAFLLTQNVINNYVLRCITGKHKYKVTLDLPTIIYLLFPQQNKKETLNQYIWYSILLLAQAYFVITQSQKALNASS